MKKYFKRQINALLNVYNKFDQKQSEILLLECLATIRRGNAIVAGGMGKNIPICEKFVGTLNSLGINAHFLNINSAVHGDLGIIRPDDVVILLSKSGETEETIHLCDFLFKRNVKIWLLTCNKKSILSTRISHTIVFDIKKEGDLWNLVPNNSSVTFLIYLQALAMAILEKLPVKLETFKNNHPGGHIGEILRKQKS